MYRTTFLWLGEAARLIARQLASDHPTKDLDEASALDNARRQLVQALFDGEVYSEGVWWTVPAAEDPSEPPPLPKPDKWRPIETGWWSHERYEHNIIEYHTDEITRLLLIQENSTDEEVAVRHVEENAHLLDLMLVSWGEDSFEPRGSYGDAVCTRIRVRRVDLETHFGVREAELQPFELKQRTDIAASLELGEPAATGVTRKRRTRPDPVRTAVHAWLDKSLQENTPDWISDKSDSWLALWYSKTSAIGHPRAVRKLIAAWRKEHGLTRATKDKKSDAVSG